MSLKKLIKVFTTRRRDVNSIILAASQGELGKLTKDIPKTLLRIKDSKTILAAQIDSFNKVKKLYCW